MAKTSVLVPLYQYPVSDQTWQPLHDAISAHPNVDFLVVVNPNSGPGGSRLPGHDYVREVPKLNSHANVRTVGYVLIDYCKRPLTEVYADIATYAGWASDADHPGLGLNGILLDETPNHYSADRADYLEALRKYIKASQGLLGERLVMHNPGTPPDAGFANPGPDVVVTCEEPYALYKSAKVQQRLAEYPREQHQTGFMISAVPSEEIARLVRELHPRGAYIFVTDLVDDFYESFGLSWLAFVEAMDQAEVETDTSA